MRVLIIGAPFLPIPAVEGGAIESLVEEYLRFNSSRKKFNITVYSPYSEKISKEAIQEYKNTTFRFIKSNCIFFKLCRVKQGILRRIFKNKQVHTAYCENVIKDLKTRKELDKYDIVIIENQIESLIRYRKKIKGRIAEHLHNDYLNTSTLQAEKITRACNEFWGVSQFITNQIKSINPSSTTFVLYNGVDSKKYDTSKITIKEQQKIYNKIGFKKQDFIILYCGRIMPEKGVLELVRAFNIEKKDKPNLKLVLVGAKKNNSDEINNYINEIKKEQSKNKDSIYIYGQAKLEELKLLYSIANLQVIPSMCEEAFGLIVIEGMCAKNPLIITQSGGMPEIVGKSAVIIKRNNIVEELSNEINNIYTGRKKTNEMIKKYDEIIKKFSIENYCKKFENLIEKKG